MRIQPRQELLDVWRETSRYCWRDGRWGWGGWDGSNSISDAEQVLVILLPAVRLPLLALDRPDTTGRRVAASLSALGDVHAIPAGLIGILTEYHERYSDAEQRPTFAGDSSFRLGDGTSPHPDQRGLEIVDSFAVSITLSLAAIGFTRVYRETPNLPPQRQADLDRLATLAGQRLTAAMVGLLRSFSVSTFAVGSAEGAALLRTVNQANDDDELVAQRLRDALQDTTASLGEVLIGSGQAAELRERPNDLYECGWSWGVIEGAPVVPLEGPDAPLVSQPEGVARNAPSLYFTVRALDAVEELFSERTRMLGLLDEEQQRLARALQLRWDLTHRYWATVATFGDGPRWPVEDIPWRTTDRDESDYHTLLVTSMTVNRLSRVRGSDAQLSRLGSLLAELAQRARVTRRPAASDPRAVALHSPGLAIVLEGSEKRGGGKLRWAVSDFSPLLFQQSLMIAGLLRDAEQRERLLNLADLVWDHLALRRLDAPRLWDQPRAVFPELRARTEPSWHHTERVVEALVAAGTLLTRPPLVDDRLVAHAAAMLAEAEHLYDVELMNGSEPGIRDSLGKELLRVQLQLARARDVHRTRPATAVSLTADSLLRLDLLSAARRERD